MRPLQPLRCCLLRMGCLGVVAARRHDGGGARPAEAVYILPSVGGPRSVGEHTHSAVPSLTDSHRQRRPSS